MTSIDIDTDTDTDTETDNEIDKGRVANDDVVAPPPSLGRASAGAAMDDGAASLYWNPAALGLVSNDRFGLGYEVVLRPGILFLRWGAGRLGTLRGFVTGSDPEGVSMRACKLAEISA